MSTVATENSYFDEHAQPQLNKSVLIKKKCIFELKNCDCTWIQVKAKGFKAIIKFFFFALL